MFWSLILMFWSHHTYVHDPCNIYVLVLSYWSSGPIILNVLVPVIFIYMYMYIYSGPCNTYVLVFVMPYICSGLWIRCQYSGPSIDNMYVLDSVILMFWSLWCHTCSCSCIKYLCAGPCNTYILAPVIGMFWPCNTYVLTSVVCMFYISNIDVI